ncbi:tetrapyrrole biosynthesis, uroporphyrinogen III synthase [Scleroderma yunnanense]
MALKNVLLLRTPAEGGVDNFESAFSANGYSPISVPVLETIIVNLKDLSNKIATGPRSQNISGVIVTSKRGIEAWSDAVKSIVSGDPGIAPSDSADWVSVPFYVIGEATASAAAELRKTLPSRLIPDDIRGQTQSGTAEQLARFILSDLTARANGSTARTLLYLTGDKNRDTLPKILTSGGVGLDVLQVYATHVSPSFPYDLKNAMVKAALDPSQSWGWIVFFAPSAAEQVMPTLLKEFQFQSIDSSAESRDVEQRVKIAVIGPTTASFVQDILKLHVDVVAPKPTSNDLASAIVRFDS